ncbi:MAG: hypothetical protein J0H65_09190 [Rhizobiales bacterium]|nr:hypothetical protein [Hyphomicrobiales bacterium]
MISKFKMYALTWMVTAALTIDQALAFASPWKPGPGGPGPGHGPAAAPELDGTGAIAVFALLASIAVVLFNRTRNK